MIERLVGGSHRATTEFLSLVARAPDGATRAALLDPLAQAAQHSGHALEVLLTAIDVQSLAEPAIRSLLFDPHEIEDVGQDVLIEVSQSIGSYRGDARFTTWLGSVARNTTISHLRRKRDTARLDGAGTPSSAERLSSIIASRSVLTEAIGDLDEKYREPLVLRDVEQLAYQDIADRLGQPLGTTKSLIFRARAMLAATIDLDVDVGAIDDG